jgi:hypothetical protein
VPINDLTARAPPRQFRLADATVAIVTVPQPTAAVLGEYSD